MISERTKLWFYSHIAYLSWHKYIKVLYVHCFPFVNLRIQLDSSAEKTFSLVFHKRSAFSRALKRAMGESAKKDK